MGECTQNGLKKFGLEGIFATENRAGAEARAHLAHFSTEMTRALIRDFVHNERYRSLGSPDLKLLAVPMTSFIAVLQATLQQGAVALGRIVFSMRRGGRFAGDLQKLVEDFGQRHVEVLVVGLLQIGELDGA